ncbi:MAG: hypothetical protein KDK70_08810 [Myxococcales bacterium]|nr:hypothetical protein [Myxococcales bacterium]
MMHTLRWGIATLLVTALAAPAWAQANAQTQAHAHVTPVADRAAPLVPMVKVEIKHRGQVLTSAPQRLDWDEAGAIRLQRGDRIHDVTLRVTRKDDQAKTLQVTLTYELDGERVIEDFAYDTKARKREVLRTDGVALAVTVTPRPLEDDGPVGRKDKLEPPVDVDDPLAGL